MMFAFTDETRDLARNLLDDGASYREVARTIGCCRETVRHAFPGRGWTYREAGAFTAAMKATAR